MSAVLIRFSMLLCLLFPLLGKADPIADGSSMCDVPVCNISETMNGLSKMTGDQRGMYALDLKNKYKDSSDINVLKNLYDTGLELKKLFISLNDADWVQRAAVDLINQVVFNLAKYSEVNGEQLTEYYQQFINQTFRYNLIAYWHSQVSSIEDLSILQELIVFAEGARTHSIAVKDEDWVSRAAGSLISDITIKLTHLDPIHEGLYEVTMSDASEAIRTVGFDRIAVLDSSTSKNLVVVFMNTKLRVAAYTYSHAEIIGNTVSGLFLSNGQTANKFTFALDRSNGDIEGFVESTKHDKIEFTGRQIFSTKSIFSGQSPYSISSKDIIGTMSGEMAGVKGKLSIRSFQANVYSATFISDNGSVILNFQGKFFAKNAVLSLTSGDKIKLTLSLRGSVREAMWEGASFSTATGVVSPASFIPLK